VIDPLGSSSDTTLNNLDLFPYTYLGNPNLTNPWNATLFGTRWPVRRITVLDTGGLMRKTVAETIFRLRDDLAVEQPDESDRPSIQRWDLADVDFAGTANGTPNDPSDDTLLRRQYKGDYSWFATIVPVTGAGLQALQPAISAYGEIRYDVSVVVFRKRDDTPSATSERLINAELLQGGELILFSPLSNTDPQAKQDVDAAVDDIRPGNWISLMGVNQTTGDFVMKWYRLLSLDDETDLINVPSLGSNLQGRRAMLIGPDWPAVPNGAGGVLPQIADLRAGLFPGTISVTTKPLKMEDFSLWKTE